MAGSLLMWPSVWEELRNGGESQILERKDPDPEAGVRADSLGERLDEILDKLSKVWKTSKHGVRGQSPWAEATALSLGLCSGTFSVP